MSQQIYNPGPGNTPFGNTNTNPQASNYGTESQFSPTESILIAKAIKRAIFDAAPAQYNALKLLFAKPAIDVNLDEHEYLEHTFGRSPIEATGIVAAAVAVPGANVSQVIPVTAASITKASIDLVLVYPDGSHAVVVAVGPGNQITVNSLTNSGLPAVSNLDIFSVQSSIMADGMDTFSVYERLETVTRYNYVQFFMRARRWARLELQKYMNAGTTDYISKDKSEQLRQIRVDMFNSLWNGERGEYALANGYVAKAMGGIKPLMDGAGSATANPTLAGLAAAFEGLAFQTNFKREGATRFVYGTDEVLNEFSKIYKQPGLMYEPNNELANLKLKRIELGTMNFVLVPCELWREESCFPADWARRVIVLDQETVNPVKVKGIPQMSMGQTLKRQNNGTRENFMDFWAEAQLGLQFHNPLGSFSLDIQ